MLQELEAEAFVIRGAFDEAGNVSQSDALIVDEP
jgi:hypothetical protein